MSKREHKTYYIVPEYKRDPKRSTGAFYAKRVRYTIRALSFPKWCKSGIITDLEGDLSLSQAKRKLKSWRAWDRKQK